MRIRHSIAGTALLLSLSAGANAQSAGESSWLTSARASLAGAIQSGTASDVNDIDYIALVARPKGSLVRLLQQFEDERSDKQIGTTSSSAGTTTLVSKGTVPKILAFAVENGAVTRSQSGTTMTFRSNLGGAVRALAGKGFFQLTPADDPAVSVLDRLGVSVSFDPSRGQTSGMSDASTFTGDRQQLSQWTARVQLLDRRNPNQPSFLEKVWKPRLGPLLESVSKATGPLYDALEVDPEVVAWLAEVTSTLETVKRTSAALTVDEQTKQIEEALKNAEMTLAQKTLRPETLAALVAYDQTTGRFVQARHDALKALAGGALVALEYTNDRPFGQPGTSNLRLVGEAGGSVDLTGNASITLFNEIPMGASGRVRDFQASGQLDIRLGSADTSGAFIFSIAGQFLRQFENSYGDGGVIIPDTKGTMAVAQLKLTIPAGKGSGTKIPLSVTFANRTEFIKESIIRANIGITYDLDALFSRFKP